jgi:hypothetical protein
MGENLDERRGQHSDVMMIGRDRRRAPYSAVTIIRFSEGLARGMSRVPNGFGGPMIAHSSAVRGMQVPVHL